ncbi:MAG: hypothetical protein KZQ99_15815 [Candidatus Thiodiazotropha sp. (ex Dulcina madagascariensis)]|nr:hypothetical protein [Candidatus Thiodiazotropha sp. (ex Dulcina madagascariensis)]
MQYKIFFSGVLFTFGLAAMEYSILSRVFLVDPTAWFLMAGVVCIVLALRTLLKTCSSV